MMNRLPTIVVYCVMAAFIAGCASSAPSRFYTLSVAPAPEAAPPLNCSVSVGPLSVPAVVNRPQIVVQTGPNQVSIAELERWSSPLKEDVARIVAANLVAMLGTPRVTLFPQSSAAGATYRVAIDVLRFESEPSKAATLDALWTVSPAKDVQKRSGRRTIVEPAQGDGYAALVAAHSRALGKLSAEIAVVIREMEAQKP